MNKKQSGLLTAMTQQSGLINAMPESEADRNKREEAEQEVERKRDLANLPAWIKANADLVGDLEKMSKDDLKLFVILSIMKYGNEKALSEFVIQKLAKTEISLEKTEFTLEKHQCGLNDEGRQSGGNTMKARSVAYQNFIKDFVVGILKNPATFDWRDGRIVKELMDPKNKYHEFKGVSIGERQMRNHVKNIRENYKANNSTG